MEDFTQYERMPEGMNNYLANNGWHFSKRMAEWAISMMRDKDGRRVEMKDKQELDGMMRNSGIDTSKMLGYDAVYVEAMARSDFFGRSVPTDSHLIKFIEDYLCDKDGYDGIAFSRFYTDTLRKGIPVLWDDLL